MLGNAFVMTTLPAEDLKRATQFYTEVLGLKIGESPDEYSTVFDAGHGTKVFMYTRGRATAENTAATFRVKDLDATVNGIIAKGGKFEQYNTEYIKTNELGIAVMGTGPRVAWITDTEGNILAIVEE